MSNISRDEDQGAEDKAGAPAPLRTENYLIGMGAGVIAFFLFATMNAMAKYLTDHHNVFEIAFYRNFFAVLPFLFMIFVMGKRDILRFRGKGVWVIVRAIAGAVSLITTFSAFAAMPMADTTAFLFTSSLLVPALGFFFLGERVGIYRWSAILIGFAGVLIMLRPTGEVNALGVTLALSAAILHGVIQTMLRAMGRVERPETITFYFLLLGTIISAIPLPFTATPPSLEHMPLLIGIGIVGGLAQMFLSVAYGNAPANIITVFNYSGLIWATIYGWFIWSDWPTAPIWIGGVIVIASNVFIVWREARLSRKQGKMPADPALPG